MALAFAAVHGLASSSACIDGLAPPTGPASSASAGGAGGSGASSSSAQAMGGGGAGGTSSCEQLPGATVDPSCLNIAGGAPTGCAVSNAGCFRTDASDCNAGCTCGTNACPTPIQSCPQPVQTRGGACLAAAGFMSMCPCGGGSCVQCLQICDGEGHVVAMRPPSDDLVLAFDIVPPDTGTLSLYIRARGKLDGVTLSAFGQTPVPLTAPMGSSDPETEFADYIVPDLQTWSDAGSAPGSVGLRATMNTDVVAEIDCMVPFIE